MAAPDVRVRLSAEGVAEVVAALRKIQAEAQTAGKKTSRSFADLSSVLGSAKGLLAQLGVALSVGSFIAFIKNAARAGEEVGNLAQRTGRTTESMLALSLVASKTNTDIEQLAKSVIFLDKNVQELEEGRGDAPELFRQIGISLDDLKGKDAAERLDLVVNALGKLKDSGEKAILTVALLGKGADRLIPLFNDLSEGGLKRTIARMRELGVNDAVIRQVGDLDNALDDLGQDAKLVGLAFAAELTPDVVRAVRAIANALEGDGIESIKSFARFFGGAMRVITGAALLGAESIRSVFMLIWGPIETVTRAGIQTMKGQFAEALETLTDGAKKSAKEIFDFSRRAQIIRDLLSPAEEPKGRRGGRETEPVDPSEAFRRREQLLSSALDNELKLIQARLKGESEGQKRAFDQGLTGVREYYRQRRIMVERETAAEMQVLLKRLLLERSNPDKVARSKNIGEIESKLAVLGVQEAAQKAAIAGEELTAVRELGDKRLDFMKKQMELEGQRHAAVLLDIDQEAEALAKVLQQQEPRRPAADRAAEVESFRAAARARAEVDRIDEFAQNRLNELALERRSIEADILAGRISELEGEQRILALERERLPQLRAIAEAQLQAALATKDEVAIFQARERIVALDELEASIIRAADATRELKDGFQSAIEGAARSFLLLEDDVLRAEGTFKHFFFTVIDGLRQILAQILATQFARRIGGLFSGGGGGGFDLFEATGGQFLRKGGLVRRHATGGFVSGPGTGTSDSIPARLSAGEYVVRAAAVRRPGVLPHLEAINRGPAFTRDDILQAQQGMRDVRLRSLADFSRSSPARFAEGGLVGAARGGAAGGTKLDGTITLVLPEGATATVDASEETRRILRIVQKNPRAFRHAQGL